MIFMYTPKTSSLPSPSASQGGRTFAAFAHFNTGRSQIPEISTASPVRLLPAIWPKTS